MKFDYRTLASNLFIYVFRMLPYVLFCCYNCIPKLRVIKENMHHFAVCVELYAFLLYHMQSHRKLSNIS